MHSTRKLLPYTPPPWAAHLRAPAHRVQLKMAPTPVQSWALPGLPTNITAWIKRDDLTGSILGGNKVRKLEFIIADAISKGATTILTCGSVESNHARATAAAAREVGMESYLFLRSDTPSNVDIGCVGNMLLDKMVGAHCILTPRESYLTGLLPRMQSLAAELEKQGEVPYIVPVGGSDNDYGLWGYIEGFHEMEKQGVLEAVDDIIVTCGSGGTAAGLAIGNLLTGSRLRVHGFTVCDSQKYFSQHVQEALDALGLNEKADDLLSFVDGYKGKGYGRSRDEELDTIAEVARKTGILLDPVYTGKAIHGLRTELCPESTTGQLNLQGNRILFIHTGGIFSLYDGRLDPHLQHRVSTA